MSVLNDSLKEQIKAKLKEVEGDVDIIFFKPKEGCQFCADTEEIANAMNELSGGKVGVDIFTFEENKDKAKEYEVNEAPVIVLKGKEKRHIQFHGIPSGYEFGSFLQMIIDISKGKPNLPGGLMEDIKSINYPVHIRVFVTPTCPYCAPAAKSAMDFALLNPGIKADIYEAIEYRQLASKYAVMGVPKIVINEELTLEGAYPPDIILKKIKDRFGS
ncbi:thioredoxin family protein [Candidatus Micrarchaeota archaeon]|nr:thioredoxin family protein [Candidatus Micrarchaeota archaeon]